MKFKRQRSQEVGVDLTPLIDVVFLLLIFFMVTSTMQPDEVLDIPTSVHGLGVEANSAILITISAGEPPMINLVEDNNKTEDPETVGPYVQERMQQGRKHVIIKAERLVQHGFVQKVTREANTVIKEFDGAKFSIATEDKP
ncbi:MAG TPA: biopolymer transporter ExbD [Planctomycetaceae bacterium]|nr:biopolymer transporter ExbD [Planctomycetaceae bacterium]